MSVECKYIVSLLLLLLEKGPTAALDSLELRHMHPHLPPEGMLSTEPRVYLMHSKQSASIDIQLYYTFLL